MDRQAWLKKIHALSEALYDHVAPAYWVTYGFYSNETHLKFIEKFLSRLSPGSLILDAACGAGRYDGILLAPGHRVIGIDQSSKMVSRAREIFPPEIYPNLRYEQIRLQEIDFSSKFDGAICIDAMEHICPEDWPGILTRFQKALKPGGVLYFTVEEPEGEQVQQAYDRAKAFELPVVYGEVVDKVDEADLKKAGLAPQADLYVYHYYPTLEQVRAWLNMAGLIITEEGSGTWYVHFLSMKNPS
jgi:2-polyprenyl-3-methyl-5-hydroxy-6-metoxy-1,4-benzoquinol methylase